MRDLTDEYKLSARSTPEVFLVLGQMTNRLQAERRIRFRGKKPTRAAIVNAALLYLDSLPQAQWEAALQLGLTRLEEFLAQDESPAATPPVAAGPAVAATQPAPAPASAPAPAPASPAAQAPDRRVDLTVEDVSSEVPPARRPRSRKRG